MSPAVHSNALAKPREIAIQILNHARAHHAEQRRVRAAVHRGVSKFALSANQHAALDVARVAESVVYAAQDQDAVAVFGDLYRVREGTRVNGRGRRRGR